MAIIEGIEVGDLLLKHGDFYIEELASVGDIIYQEVDNLKKEITKNIESTTVRRTGTLLGGVGSEQVGDLLWRIYVVATNKKGNNYAEYLEYGTGFNPENNHPGIVARRFFRDAVDSKRDIIRGNIDRGLGELVSRRDVNFI